MISLGIGDISEKLNCNCIKNYIESSNYLNYNYEIGKINHENISLLSHNFPH